MAGATITTVNDVRSVVMEEIDGGPGTEIRKIAMYVFYDNQYFVKLDIVCSILTHNQA